MRSHLWLSLLLAAPLTGCIADGSIGYTAAVVAPTPVVTADVQVAPAYVEEPAVEVEYTEPQALVYVSPEVQVVEEFDYPVFFYSGLYYRQEGGLWYSSGYHDRGWVESVSTPNYVTSIERPESYVHYRANVNARPGEIGYRNTGYTHPVHSSPPPRYVEHPPAQRGQPPIRGNNNYNHYQASRAQQQSHNTQQTGHPAGWQNNQPQHNGMQHPNEPAHNPGQSYQHNNPPANTYNPPAHTNPPANTYHAPPPPAHNNPPPKYDQKKHK
jgi:hypothetical protein